VLERDALLGGTTAISGGVVWAPANRCQLEAGIRDTPEAALHYLQELATGDVDVGLMATFVADAPRVMDALEAWAPLEWALLTWPDYHSEMPSGMDGGRSIWPKPLTLPAAVASRVRRPVELGDAPLDPASDGVVFRGPVRGHALAGALVAALVDAGVELRTSVRATGLLIEDGENGEDGEVVGVEAAGGALRGRVVLATGGFQHDARLAATFLPVPGIAPLGTPGCVGDGLRMAMAAGAELANMAEGWWMPALHVPGEVLDGAAYYRPLHSERAQPGSVMVDRAGRRFVDEAQNYGDVGRSLFRFDAATHTFPAAPCWLVFDAGYRATYPVGPVGPADPDPPWLVCAGSIEDLATTVGPGLPATIATFNEAAVAGEDAEFGRGSLPYDRWIGDTGRTLGPLKEPPFYAAAVVPGCLGTKGGPRTDDRGRVLRPGGTVIGGLYAVGNAAASPFGTATAAGGATLGPALVFGVRAGEAAGSHDG
jgi:3-oxosteroid 1-dehydrogenase